jgi:hypothetical protein
MHDEYRQALESGSDYWHPAPFNTHLAIDLRDGSVWVCEFSELYVGLLVHELGHLHAPGAGPIERACEWDWLGWEIAVASEAGIFDVWSASNADYAIDGDGRRWCELSASERDDLIAERLAHAQRSGMIDTTGRAIWKSVERVAR